MLIQKNFYTDVNTSLPPTLSLDPSLSADNQRISLQLFYRNNEGYIELPNGEKEHKPVSYLPLTNHFKRLD